MTEAVFFLVFVGAGVRTRLSFRGPCLPVRACRICALVVPLSPVLMDGCNQGTGNQLPGRVVVAKASVFLLAESARSSFHCVSRVPLSFFIVFSHYFTFHTYFSFSLSLVLRLPFSFSPSFALGVPGVGWILNQRKLIFRAIFSSPSFHFFFCGIVCY